MNSVREQHVLILAGDLEKCKESRSPIEKVLLWDFGQQICCPPADYNSLWPSSGGTNTKNHPYASDHCVSSHRDGFSFVFIFRYAPQTNGRYDSSVSPADADGRFGTSCDPHPGNG